MQKILLILMLLPVVTFGQLSKEDQQSINDYSDFFCSCINDIMKELHPKAVEFVKIIGEKGEEGAIKDLEVVLTEISVEETQKLLASFEKMESAEFGLRIEACDAKNLLSDSINEELENSEGNAYYYFIGYLSGSEACELTKIFYDIGTQKEE